MHTTYAVMDYIPLVSDSMAVLPMYGGIYIMYTYVHALTIVQCTWYRKFTRLQVHTVWYHRESFPGPKMGHGKGFCSKWWTCSVKQYISAPKGNLLLQNKQNK